MATKKLLPGIDEETNSKVTDRLNNSVQYSAATNAAQSRMAQAEGNKPGAFSSTYTDQLRALTGQMAERKPFTYDYSTDPLYQQYRQMYMQQGRQASVDAQAQAAQLTGGYRNSYGATAGNQAYQQYLTRLNDQIPALYDMALKTYNANLQGDQARLGALQQGYENDRNAYQMDYDQWLNDRGYYADQYNTNRQYDTDQYNHDLQTWLTLAGQQNTQYNTDRSQAYTYALMILNNGKMPSDDILGAAGISRSDAKKMMKQKKGRNKSSGKSSSSSSKRSAGNNDDNDTSETPPTTSQDPYDAYKQYTAPYRF